MSKYKMYLNTNKIIFLQISYKFIIFITHIKQYYFEVHFYKI